MNEKCVLILGAGGFIGRSLSRTIVNRGWSVLAGTRKPEPFNHQDIVNLISPFNEADHFIPSLEKCSIVVHAASHTTPSSSAASPQLDGNLRSTLALLEALQKVPRRLIYLSSGGTLYQESSSSVTEDTPLRPRSYHGAGKAAAEHFIQAWTAQTAGAACILRPSNVYGPGQYVRTGFGIIPAAFESILMRKPLNIWGDGLNVRDYLYIDDLMSLCTKILMAPQDGGVEVFNAANGIGVSLVELLSRIERVTGQKVDRIFSAARDFDMRHVVPDSGRARQAFGWQPKIELDEGLARAWRWFEKMYE